MSIFPSYRSLQTFLLAALMVVVPMMSNADTRNYEVTSSDGVSIAVQESGAHDGPAIVFIHGYLGSHLNWLPQVESPLLQKYRLITYDLRGHGLSGKPSNGEAYRDGRRWADDLARVIAASDVHDAILVGWSLGGAVISNYLDFYGDGDIGGAIYVDGVVELKPDQIAAHPDIYRDLVSPDLETHLQTVRDFLRLCFHQQPDDETFQLLFANAALASWVMQENVQSISVPLAGLGKATKPILMLYGKKDALVKVSETIERAKAINPEVGTLLYDNSGHAPFIEEAERFNRDLAEFVEGALQ
ncbi:alpha/beta hydrolase [Marinobacter nanhaiticus D15-8W]|uniref:Alpha/beta hydrolase n=1 Tax=Marinobacter nanhaiticus D15-8W TaxID=626887 RepID=N6W0F9_9GAMM|nr:alpha/beta hydrolase [Marinobacter nanhaiticus]ENO16015.1 alpha/beta hydrolase [Marinobacter nanhaiticus D15-8W]BES73126.1 alpha/beta hydrolase [Marinobacter nanhaiticus D15-8W]